MKEEIILKKLLKLAKKAAKKNEIPISALITYNNKIISKGYNKREKNNLTIAHAEIEAIIKANKKIKNWRLNKCTLYVLVEPCDMCKNVIKESRIEKVYYLLERLEYKKAYNNTKFIQLKDEFDIKQNYIKIKDNFWKKLR